MITKNLLIALMVVTSIITGGCSNKKWVSLEESQPEVFKYLSLKDTSNYDSLGDRVMIPDEETAISVAEVYLFKTFGKEKIEEEQPYQIGKVDGYWIIKGTMPSKYILGGFFEMVINSKNGEVVRLFHGK